MIRNESCISTSTCHGSRPRSPRKKRSMDLTAPRPSKTAPKQSEAIRIHMNMQVMPSVF